MSSSRSSSLGLIAATTAAAAVGVFVYQHYKAQDSTKDPVARIFASKDDTAKELCAFVVEQGKLAIEQRGVFHLAVAGGSLLDALSQLKNHKADLDWSKVVLSFANHKCVTPTSEKSTLIKAKAKFADSIGIAKFVPLTSNPTENGDGSDEAKAYAKALIEADIPHIQQFPVFDLIVLGLGEDGHVGSCTPMGPAVANTNNSVVGSPKTEGPSSITLSIESMNSARELYVIVCGGGKKEAVKRALKRPADKPRGTFPAQLLDGPTFFLDAEAAANL